jgi:hypothetical protein
VGFEEGEGGQLFAVVGQEKVPLPPGHYYWHAAEQGKLCAGQKVEWALWKAGQTTAVALLIVGVVVVCAGVVVLYAMAASHSPSSL